MLIFAEDHLQGQHHGPSIQRELLEQIGCVLLAGWQSVIIAHQQHVGPLESLLQLRPAEYSLVLSKSLAEFPEIFEPAVRIGGLDFALHLSQRKLLGSSTAASTHCEDTSHTGLTSRKPKPYALESFKTG